MALIVIDKNPSPRNLAWFGVIIAIFFGVIGTITYYSTGHLTVPSWLWSAGFLLAIVYYSVPPWRKAMYIGWMYLSFPIGWVISHLVLLMTYYLVVTPIGLLLRLAGKDLLDEELRPSAETYFIPRTPVTDKRQYFRQF